MVFLYVTNENQKEAEKIARHLLGKRMIGCANFYPIRSMYWWKDKIVDDQEYVLIAKTTNEKWEEARQEIKRVHPYKTPCILKMDVDPNQEYLDWVENQLK